MNNYLFFNLNYSVRYNYYILFPILQMIIFEFSDI